MSHKRKPGQPHKGLKGAARQRHISGHDPRPTTETPNLGDVGLIPTPDANEPSEVTVRRMRTEDWPERY